MRLTLMLAVSAAACGDADTAAPPASPTPTERGEAETTSSPSPFGLRYENTEFGYTLEYPESWGVDKSPQQQGIAVQFFALESEADQFSENVNVTAPEELSLDLTPKQYATAGLDNIRSQMGDVEVIEEDDVAVGNAPAFSTEFEGELQGQRLHWLQVYLVEDRMGIVLTYTGRDEDFDTYRSEAEAIIGSFRLL